MRNCIPYAIQQSVRFKFNFLILSKILAAKKKRGKLDVKQLRFSCTEAPTVLRENVPDRRVPVGLVPTPPAPDEDTGPHHCCASQMKRRSVTQTACHPLNPANLPLCPAQTVKVSPRLPVRCNPRIQNPDVGPAWFYQVR